MALIDMNCYIRVKGEKIGPLSEQDILLLYKKRVITDDTMFTRVGMIDWITLSQSGITSEELGDSNKSPVSKL